MCRPFVVVTGLPGSGKSHLASMVSDELSLPVLDKDAYLESLFPDHAISRDERTHLSRLADKAFMEAAESSDGAILVSFWRRPGVDKPSGTPVEWLAELGDIVEVFCDCPPEIAADRFLRRSRHTGHGDDRWTDRNEVIVRFSDPTNAGPFGLGQLVTVDTSAPFDPNHVATRVAEALGDRRPLGPI